MNPTLDKIIELFLVQKLIPSFLFKMWANWPAYVTHWRFCHVFHRTKYILKSNILHVRSHCSRPLLFYLEHLHFAFPGFPICLSTASHSSFYYLPSFPVSLFNSLRFRNHPAFFIWVFIPVLSEISSESLSASANTNQGSVLLYSYFSKSLVLHYLNKPSLSDQAVLKIGLDCS